MDKIFGQLASAPLNETGPVSLCGEVLWILPTDVGYERNHYFVTWVKLGRNCATVNMCFCHIKKKRCAFVWIIYSPRHLDSCISGLSTINNLYHFTPQMISWIPHDIMRWKRYDFSLGIRDNYLGQTVWTIHDDSWTAKNILGSYVRGQIVIAHSIMTFVELVYATVTH